MIEQNDNDTLLNQASSQMLVAQASTAGGSWQVVAEAPVIGIHAALLHTGKVFLIGGSSLDPDNRRCPDCSAVWDVNNNTFNRPITPTDEAGIVLDLFCVGHSFRPDGRLFVAGGTLQYNPYKGSTAGLIFDPTTEQWTKLQSMNYGRWYPTLVTLGSGRILVVSGINEQGNGLVRNAEIYSSSFGWGAFTQETASPFPMYAGLVLMQDGRIFYSGANFEDVEGATPRILTLPSQFTQAIAEQAVPGLTDPDKRNQCATVLLPPAQDQKVMIIGGGDRNTFGAQTTTSVNIVDLKESNPTYKPAASLKSGRIHHNAILLPDRTVFVCCGSSTGEDRSSPIPPAEIYNPLTDTWTQVATQSVPRIYHSAALLLPDGRVATAGSTPGFGIENHERRLEVYSPAYMSQPRPVIQSAPQTVQYGNTIKLQTSQAGSIKWVSLIKPMATTHSLDTEQRLVDVPITSKTNTSVDVTVTSNRNLAPPGWYMLFITDTNNVPSVASWIRLR